MNKIKTILREWLGVSDLYQRVNTLESLLLHKESRYNGFAVLKPWLNDPKKPLPTFAGKPIE